MSPTRRLPVLALVLAAALTGPAAAQDAAVTPGNQTPEEIAAITRLNELQAQVSRARVDARVNAEAEHLARLRTYEQELERQQQQLFQYEMAAQEQARAEANYQRALRAHEAATQACLSGDRLTCEAAWHALGMTPPE